MNLLIRFKSRLFNFAHTLIPRSDFLMFRDTPHRTIADKWHKPYQRFMRAWLSNHPEFKKLVSGKGKYVIEMVIRNGRVMIAVYRGYATRQEYHTNITHGMRDLRESHHFKELRKGQIQVSMIDRVLDPRGEKEATKLYYEHENPLFVFRPETDVPLPAH